MLTKKTLLTKWGLYALAMVLLFAAQQLFLDPIALSPLGASPFLAPMLVAVVAALEGKGYTFLEADVQMVPQNYVKLTDEEDIKNMEKLIDALEDNDDVQNVYHNWEQD